MESIYRDIAERTGGNFYIGVVGPVRTGKSTFIKKFMESLVIPNIAGDYDRERARDELPQSAGGKTVMTTEPKFIPDEAVEINVSDSARLRVKMVDCVGYIVPEALGQIEDGVPRMVRTPWSDEPMLFSDAAETGTRKVIREHSTIGMLVTTDGTIGDIPRASYVEAEEKVARELKQMGKPFAVILNSAEPDSATATSLALELEEKYGVPVALVSCLTLDAEDIRHILELVLMEFPVREIKISLPSWTGALEKAHWLKRAIVSSSAECAEKISKIGEIRSVFTSMGESEHISGAQVTSVDLSNGNASVFLNLSDDLYYRIIGELTGLEITGEGELLSQLKELSQIKKEYDKFAAAIDEVNDRGYGIVMPDADNLTLEEPQIVKQAGGYGIRLRASAPSIHMIKAGIETEINPIVGTEQQSEEIVRYMMREFDEDPKKIWESNLFGKSLYELVNEGLHTKLDHMPQDARQKLSETLARIINEGSGGLICIIL
jgi:stage IV sporulation protein A